MKKIILILSLLSVLAIAQAQTEKSDVSDNSVQKNELKMTPEITELVLSNVLRPSFKNLSDKGLSNFGVKDRAQLMNVELGKPIPIYAIGNDSLKFIGKWTVPVMSDGEPLFLADVRLMEDGQYKYDGMGAAKMAQRIHNYEHKDLMIGIVRVYKQKMDYYYIRKDNQDIFVKVYDYATREYFTEYSLSEIINQIKE